MKVNHYQVKNAIAHVSKELQRQFPNKQLGLHRIRRYYGGWEFYIESLNDDHSRSYGHPKYWARFSEIGTDESISLDGIFIETFGIANALDAAARFINHSDKIFAVSLGYLLSETLGDDKKWKLFYGGTDMSHNTVLLDIVIDAQAATILNVELDYPRHAKAVELAENFIKQSPEIATASRVYASTYAGKGIHVLNYEGINSDGMPIKLSIKVDAQIGIIISSEISRSK